MKSARCEESGHKCKTFGENGEGKTICICYAWVI